MKFKIKIDDRELNRDLADLERRATNLGPPLKAIGQVIVDSVQDNFTAGGRYSKERSWKGGTKKWKPLSPATLKRKKNKGKILIEQGHLMSSIHYRLRGDSGVPIGPSTSIKYALAQQFGMGRRSSIKTRRKMPALPARPYLVVQREDLGEV